MKRIVSLSLVAAMTLGTVLAGTAGAHQEGDSGASQGRKHDHPDPLKAWTACVLAPTISGTSVFAKATPAKPGGSVAVAVKVRHPDTTLKTYGATVTPTFPTAGAGPQVTLTRKGASFQLRGAVPVPSTATAGSAALAVAGTYGSSTFTCAGLAAKIQVPQPSRSPVCTSVPAGLGVWAWATPATPGGTLRVVVMVKKQAASATFVATATATIPPAAATPSQALSPLGKGAVLTGSFAVDKGATLGATATVAVSGTYAVANTSTTFACSLSSPIRNVRLWRPNPAH